MRGVWRGLRGWHVVRDASAATDDQETNVTHPVQAPLADAVLEALRAFDTPTICNAMEIVAPERRLHGYTVKPLVCPFPDLPPIVGYARTATIRAASPPDTGAGERRAAYYEYVGRGPRPTVSVVQDLDGANVGYGAFWGEVNSTVHKALGCLGVVTDGVIRDIPQWAPGFQALAGSIGPSHAWVHLQSFDEPVTVAGMTVRPGDLIHADGHGAIVVPFETAERLPAACDLLMRREAAILDVARSEDFTIDALKAAMARSAEIH
jgi:regulator of RNase E activity RraA